MNTDNNKTAFLDQVNIDLVKLFEDYQVEVPGDEYEAFKEDLFVLVADKVKGSFKNGVRVGRRKSE
ncbi:MAG TPA: hypothetical protein VMW42_11355 [Desulfatiglandales bacterium]|nr:hypothetical protein [Desulfatiglandales bacterium]